ncbi:MAG TPA: C4-dicarboxylate ABC transporter substrate-binding protein [Firmicutes bacterium]|jgi:tripartite ATP-independent transporter DctP family solute receptor|nr:C4-dicarboxylate ABC transporter substrate-binding protein [Bacillota bacterium]HBR28337.1 C4-dicarboxylate ABC transporter substrate-binding protein [Bacillota bacterium]HBR35474.1 C4-dicarboxylate ABC transporter substrate-binding protein [Bacillota bacterium]
MFSKKSLIVMVVFMLLLTLLIVPSTMGATRNYTLRLAHICNEGHPIHQGALLFKKTVEEKTNGAVKIQIFPNATLGSAPEFTEQIAVGAVDLGLCTSGQLQVFVPEYAVVMIPFLFEDFDHAHRTLDGEAGQLLAEKAEKKGFMVLGDWEWGFRAITNSKRPINTPEDLRGLKMRVPSEMQLQETFKALGSHNTVVAFPELYMALAQGVVDGQCNPISTIYDQKFYESQKYLAITNHSYNSEMLIMSKRVYDRLPSNYQKILKDAAIEAAPLVRRLTAESEQGLIDEMKAKGMIVTYPDLGAFRDKTEPAIAPIAKFAGEKFTAEFLEYVEAAR